jgi:CheY-like chemotaxis protein
MVVDDNSVNRIVTRQLLDSIGCIPTVVDSGQKCLDILIEKGASFVPSSHITCSILNAELFLLEEVFASLSDNFEVFLLADGWLCCCKGDS